MARLPLDVFKIPLTTLLVQSDAEVTALMTAFVASLTRYMSKTFHGKTQPTNTETDRFLNWVGGSLNDIFGKNAEDVDGLYDVSGTFPSVMKRSVIRAAREGVDPIVKSGLAELRILGIDPEKSQIVHGLRAPLPILSTKAYVDPNGYKLSTRIWKAGDEIAKQIDTVVRYELARGASPTRLADSLEQFLTAEGASTRTRKLAGRTGRVGSYSARRLVRTETSRAHGNAVMAAAHVDPFTAGVRWNLGFAHPGFDACDGNASANSYGLGKGIYPIDRVPIYPNHPHCLCFLSSVDDQNRDRVRYGAQNNLIDLSGIDSAELVKQITGFLDFD